MAPRTGFDQEPRRLSRQNHLEWSKQGGSSRQMEAARGIVEMQSAALDRMLIPKQAPVPNIQGPLVDLARRERTGASIPSVGSDGYEGNCVGRRGIGAVEGPVLGCWRAPRDRCRQAPKPAHFRCLSTTPNKLSKNPGALQLRDAPGYLGADSPPWVDFSSTSRFRGMSDGRGSPSSCQRRNQSVHFRVLEIP